MGAKRSRSGALQSWGDVAQPLRHVLAVSRCATFLLCLSVIVFSNVASAQEQVRVERITSPADQAEARALFHRAVEAFDEGDFQSALDRFERSYELSQRPVLLYNIGSAADRLRNDERAISAFRAYLEALPDADNAASVRARLTHLEATVSTQRIERVEATDEVAREPIAEIEPNPLSERSPEQVTPDAPPSGRGAGPLALLVSGGALALTGGALFTAGYLTARGVDNEEQPEWADVEARVNRSRLFLNMGYALTGVGAALLIGGAIWWSTSDAPVEVALSFNGLSVRGEF